MRKKILLEQFDSLSSAYEKCFFELSELKKEKEKLLEKISELEEKLAKTQEGFSVNTEIDTKPDEEEIVPTNAIEVPTLDDAMEYGAEIIGKIVVESARYSDMVNNKPSENTKDLINLIMGKCEICKAEILTIATGELDYNTKCDLMDSQLNDAIDYFKSVLAQI